MTSLFIDTLVAMIAMLHLGFMVLEMCLWNTPFGRKVFKITPEFAKQTRTLAANQGLYNGFLVAGLLWSLLQADANFAFHLQTFFLSCVFVAGVFGWRTVGTTVLYLQALPAAIALAWIGFNS